MKFFAVLFTIFAVSSAFRISPKDDKQCIAPNGGGLEPVLKEFVSLLPVDVLADIYLNAVTNDAEVQSVMEYLESSDFETIVVAIQKNSDFLGFLNYACAELYLDGYYYFNILGGILGLPPVVRPKAAVPFYRSGLHGMLEDMVDALPIDELRAMFEDKLASDEYLQKAVASIKSPEFKKVVDALRAIPEYQNMLQRLRALGVDVDAVLAAIRKFFEW